MRSLYENLAGKGTFLISATRMGGRHGYDDEGALDVAGGAVTGFTKAIARERPEALVKTVDFPPTRKTAWVADALIEETLRDPGPVEVGRARGCRWMLAVEQRQLDGSSDGIELSDESVIVVTGAAGSIVSAITCDLARASQGTFHLIDLTAEPDRDDPDLARFSRDRDGLKRDIFDRLKSAGDKATPAAVERELGRIEREHAALASIVGVEEAGGEVHYHAANLLDGRRIAEIIDAIYERHGRIDVLIHAAGLEISHAVPDKRPEEFELVFDVKSDGWFNVLRAVGQRDLGAAVVFSSVAGRFGNVGQTDYSAANDLLCKAVSSFRSRRPGTRGLAIDWTAWADIGMATRGSIPKMMEAAGIEMLSASAGIPVVRRELTGGGFADGEIVVGGGLGALIDERHRTGGLDLSRVQEAATRWGSGVVISTARVVMTQHEGLVLEAEFDPVRQPFLNDHRIDGTPVLPGVMGVEAFAEAAKSAFPSLFVTEVADVSFHAPFKFYRDEPRTVIVRVVFEPEGEDVVATCRLIGRRRLAGMEQPQETLHFSGRVRLSPEPPPARVVRVVDQARGRTSIDAEELYRVYFHGPAYRVVETAWRDGDALIGRLAAGLGPNHFPHDARTLIDPRLVELCLQTAGLWQLGSEGRMGLPLRIDVVRPFDDPGEAELPVHARVGLGDENGAFDAEVSDASGRVLVEVRGYKTVEHPDPIDPERIGSFRKVLSDWEVTGEPRPGGPGAVSVPSESGGGTVDSR
jgi:NAD(P)-dependent dehydrogenase (short-subunit alcohol dehydrogenase family)